MSVATATLAQAACTPGAVDATTPGPGSTVTCSGTTVDQNVFGGRPIGWGTADQTGISVNVLDGASVTGTGGGIGIAVLDAVVDNGAGAAILGDYAGIGAATLVVTNRGSIIGTTDNGIFVQTDLTLTNHAGGVVSGFLYGVLSNSGSITVYNAGNIASTGGATSVALQAATNAAVTNRAGGTISGVTGISAAGIVLNNAGRITADTSAVSATTVDVVNSGSIVGRTAGGIDATAGATVVNQIGGSITGSNRGIAVLSGNATVTNSGRIEALGTGPLIPYGIGVNGALQLVNNAGASISSLGWAVSASFTVGPVAGPGVGGSSIFNAGSISGGEYAIIFGTGSNTLTLGPGSIIAGTVRGAGSDTFQLGGTGSANFDISQLDPAAQYQGFTTFNKIDSSLWSLTGTATYTGPVNVTGGTLAVNGNLASASLLTVNSGGTLGGSGIVGATAINGGTLAPGNSIGTLTMSSLTMTAASTYLVEVSGASSDKAVVTGAATIAGKVGVNPLTRLTSTTTYTIINAGTLTGTFDSASVTSNFARNARLSYVGNNVFLTLDPGLLSPVLPGAATGNQKSIAAAIDNALEGGATMPASFNGLFLLGGNNLLNALTQISGETSTGSQQTTFDAMTQFMGVLSDPFTAGRGGTAPGASAFADANAALAYAGGRTRTGRDALAMFTKAPPRAYQPRWNVWAAGFGGSRSTDGNAALGSNRTTGSIAGGAVGADYWFSPETVAGFALAGGGTSFSVAGGGNGRSDLFQAGAFIRHNFASSYITATAAYGWQDISTDRMITAVGTEQLRANFNANAYSGRIEAGHRWLLQELGGVGLTPYAAVQATAFDLPGYAETSATGAGGFALSYAGKTITATRSELGLRGDKSFAVNDALLTLRGRAAWAYDSNSDRNVSAVFQSLPGSSFAVNGAGAARNVALTSASAEMSFNGGWSVAATFDGEFSDVSRSYAGKGVVRYAW
ncbi:autotransporter outer membrane beta-barrel domain-containing protein [Rhodopseudomonas sp. BAL398]|nr:autotransporter outer membrane beta-barrel domain-containing protein [Rhodopseudomonas sp. BAL398]